jgi:hypothetical protein
MKLSLRSDFSSLSKQIPEERGREAFVWGEGRRLLKRKFWKSSQLHKEKNVPDRSGWGLFSLVVGCGAFTIPNLS